MASDRARFRLEGQVELEYLRNHIDRWAKSHPTLVRTALFAGANKLWYAVLQKMSEVLRTRTGRLRAAVWRDVITLPDGRIDAEVFVRPGAGNLQPVKMRALELGSYRQGKGGIPYIWVAGRPQWIKEETAQQYERLGHHILRTKGPYPIRVPRHPVFKPTLQKHRTEISRMILKEIIEGFKNERATSGV